MLKKVLVDFKEFISNTSSMTMSMAIGMVIASGFMSIVTVVTEDVIEPLVELVCGGTISGDWYIPGTQINIGSLLSALISFIISSTVVYFLAKALYTAEHATDNILGPKKVVNPTCPFCLEEYKEGATVCPHCGRDLPATEAATTTADA